MDRETPSVSVIIPVFDDPAGIRACLARLQQQTCGIDGFEVIVVDNASAKPPSIPEDIAYRACVVHCPKPGSYAARNAGTLRATGKILAFTDADCLPCPDWLEEGMRAIRGQRGACVIGGEVRLTPPSRRNGTALYQFLAGFGQRENIEKKGFAATANLFCGKDTFRRVGPFTEDLLSGGDLEWSRRASDCGIPVVYAESAIIETAPRHSLQAAIRQARRVVGGRRTLSARSLHHIQTSDLRARRTGLEALTWIFSVPDLSIIERIRVLGAAVAIRLSSALERVRLAFGGGAERR